MRSRELDRRWDASQRRVDSHKRRPPYPQWVWWRGRKQNGGWMAEIDYGLPIPIVIRAISPRTRGHRTKGNYLCARPSPIYAVCLESNSYLRRGMLARFYVRR